MHLKEMASNISDIAVMQKCGGMRYGGATADPAQGRIGIIQE